MNKKEKLPRKKKKALKKHVILLYDIAAIPKFKTIREILEEIKNTGKCFWDSSLGGQEPKLLFGIGKRQHKHLNKTKFIDISKQTH